MEVKATRTINLNRVAELAAKEIRTYLSVIETEEDKNDWKELEGAMLNDLLASDDEVFEGLIAEAFAEQLHHGMIDKVLTKLKRFTEEDET